MKRLIDEFELKQLLKDSERLARLDAAGVDNWTWYDIALSKNDDFGKDYREWVDVDLNDLVKDYESLDDYIEFNYR